MDTTQNEFNEIQKREVYASKFTIESGIDDFTQLPFIKCGKLYGVLNAGFYFNPISVRFEFSNMKHRIHIDFNSQQLTKKSTIQLLFEDNSMIVFSNFSTPIKYLQNHNYLLKINRTMSTSITESDVQALSNKNLVKWQITDNDGVVLHTKVFPPETYPVMTKKFWGVDLGLEHIEYEKIPAKEIREVLREYMKEYYRLYLEMKTKNALLDTDRNSNEPCYVYLMIDTTNNFHKIGISNNPEYRERTLQSDKPSIELLCAKRYPTRAIAEAIEASLHKVYNAKRIRGEWFNLELEDILAVKETLK